MPCVLLLFVWILHPFPTIGCTRMLLSYTYETGHSRPLSYYKCGVGHLLLRGLTENSLSRFSQGCYPRSPSSKTNTTAQSHQDWLYTMWSNPYNTLLKPQLLGKYTFNEFELDQVDLTNWRGLILNEI